MTVYYCFIAYIVIIGLLAQHSNNMYYLKHADNSNDVLPGVNKNKYGVFYLMLIIGFVFISGFRYYVGTDFGAYYTSTSTLTDIKEALISFDEPLMSVITFAARIIWDDGASTILLTSLITVSLVFYGISKYDNNEITMILLMYVFTGAMGFSFNAVRQALALSLIFAFSKKAKKHWVLQYIVVVLLAAMIHKSAIVMLPVLILSQMSVNWAHVAVLIISSVIIPAFFNWAYNWMDVDMNNQDGLTYILREINPLRIAVAIVSFAIILLVKDKKKFAYDNKLITNMALINALLTITTANSAYLNRVTRYTSVYLILFIPKVLNTFSKQTKYLFTLITIALYFVYWRYEISDDALFYWVFGHFGNA